MGEVIDVQEAELRGQPFLDWITEHGLDYRTVYEIEVGAITVTAKCYARTMDGKKMVECAEANEWYLESFPDEVVHIGPAEVRPVTEVKVVPKLSDPPGRTAGAGAGTITASQITASTITTVGIDTSMAQRQLQAMARAFQKMNKPRPRFTSGGYPPLSKKQRGWLMRQEFHKGGFAHPRSDHLWHVHHWS